MRIATSTLLNSNYNYGALLQTYALQQAILNIGFQSEVIDFCRSTPLTIKERLLKKRKWYEYLRVDKIFKKIINKCLMIYLSQYINAFSSEFVAFQRKFIKKSDKLYSNKNAEEIGKNYDKIIVGSDQVWGFENLMFKSHTLDFIGSNPQKYSYAGSFGDVEVKPEFMEYVKKLADFDILTVREQSGADIIKRAIDRDVEVVLDPTFLLNKEQWIKLATQSDYELPEHYVFVYAINNKKNEILSFAKKLAKRNNGKIILVHRGDLKSWLRWKEQTCIDPADWVKLLLNADYVVTDSFHGTAFSINLEKQFYVYPNSQTTRIFNLFDMFGLHSRRCDLSDISEEIIDYTKVRLIRETQVKRSLALLKKMLAEGKND